MLLAFKGLAMDKYQCAENSFSKKYFLTFFVIQMYNIQVVST